MSLTLLEFAVAIVLIVVAWQIGLAIAPIVLHTIRALKRDVDEATEQGLVDRDDAALDQERKEKYTNGTHH